MTRTAERDQAMRAALAAAFEVQVPATCAWCGSPSVTTVVDPYDGATEPACRDHAATPRRPGSVAPQWSARELATLDQLYPAHGPDAVLAVLPRRTWSAITKRAHQRGLKSGRRAA